MIYTRGARGHEASDVLRRCRVCDTIEARRAKRVLDQEVTADVISVRDNGVALLQVLFL